MQNREQTWLDLRLSDPGSGRGRALLRETTKAWVNENGNPVWLQDGSFLWISERTGFRHVYHYRADGTLVRPVTSGRWDVRALYGVDEARGAVFIAATERGPLGVDIYRQGLDGAGLTRLSQTTGTHRAMFNPGFTRYVDSWSNAVTPPQLRLHDAADRARTPRGGAERGAGADRISAVHAGVRPGHGARRARHGRDDDQAARLFARQALSGLPVHLRRPWRGQARDRWGGVQYMFHQLLAQKGVIVWVLDNRSASGQRRGAVAGLGTARRVGAAGPGRRRRLAEAAAVRGRVPPGPERVELRRVHDRVRPHAQHAAGRRASWARR